jgi:hypothetical protein
MIFGQRIGEIVYLLKINAVLTERRCQFTAGRSGGLLVNDYLLCHFI